MMFQANGGQDARVDILGEKIAKEIKAVENTLPRRLVRLIQMNGYQARAYLGFSLTTERTARATANASAIPRSKIYSVLKELETMGYVRVLDGKPATYERLPITDCVKARIKELEEQIDDLNALDEELAPLFF